MLDLDVDPKMVRALRHREQFPVNLDTVPEEMLLRVPGHACRRWSTRHRPYRSKGYRRRSATTCCASRRQPRAAARTRPPLPAGSLWEPATQTVFGEGPDHARIVVIGEQPGDQEDLAGQPFVGPAGKVFDAALAQAGIDRSVVYVTSTVKHFKFEPRGRKPLHARLLCPRRRLA
jgi:hypothetical protein